MRLSRSKARFLRAWEAALVRRALSPATIAARRRIVVRLLRHFTGTDLCALERADLERYLALRSASVSPATQAEQATVLRGFFAALVEEDLLRASPMEEVRIRRAGRPPRLVPSEAAVARLLDGAARHPRSREAGLRDRAVVELLYGLGLRAAEARATLLVDLDLEHGTLLVRRAKRGGQRILPLPIRAVPHLRTYVVEARPGLARLGPDLDAGHLLLSGQGRPLSYDGVRAAVLRAAALAGVQATPHALRRSAATHLVRAGASVPAVQELLGHQRLDTTAGYVDVDRDDLRRAVAILDHRQ